MPRELDATHSLLSKRASFALAILFAGCRFIARISVITVQQDRLIRMKQLLSRLRSEVPNHPMIEYDREQEAESSRVEERIDIWFSLWLITEFMVLLTLMFLSMRLRQHGTSLLEIGFEEFWFLTLLAVQWVLLLIAAATTSYYAFQKGMQIRRRMLMLGLLPWGVMSGETLFALYWML